MTLIRVICGARAASCTCLLEPGHDGPHECNPVACGGAWSGTEGDGTFDIARLPLVDKPARCAACQRVAGAVTAPCASCPEVRTGIAPAGGR